MNRLTDILLARIAAIVCGTVLLQVGCAPVTTIDQPEQAPEIGVNFELISEGLNNPVSVTHAGDKSGRLFVSEQHGTIAIIKNGKRLEQPFLDIRSSVSCCGERGLLSIAFHPEYSENGYMYVNHTDPAGETVISRYRVTDNPDRANPNSGYTLLRIKQTAQIHNGGQIQFGPDGFLYIGMGDGGSFSSVSDDDSGGDPNNRAQNKKELLGKLLRLDVDKGVPYGIPHDNPFVNQENARAEIWALGLRNPWRFSFDRLTGDLFISDVGETQSEEINFQLASSAGGDNYGWRRMEGTLCFKPASNCDDSSLTKPIIEYDHYGGCAVIGGYRYRGSAVPDLAGIYLYADFCSSTVFGARLSEAGGWHSTPLSKANFSITSFGEDEVGELYATSFGENGGALYKVISATREQ